MQAALNLVPRTRAQKWHCPLRSGPCGVRDLVISEQNTCTHLSQKAYYLTPPCTPSHFLLSLQSHAKPRIPPTAYNLRAHQIFPTLMLYLSSFCYFFSRLMLALNFQLVQHLLRHYGVLGSRRRLQEAISGRSVEQQPEHVLLYSHEPDLERGI